MTPLICAALLAAGSFTHNLSGTKPWTHERFLDDPAEFHFAIVPDRTGGERRGHFARAMKTLNLLRPAFVMCVGDLVDGRGAAEPVLRRQWDELHAFVGSLQMPFFYVVGNHDIWTGFTGPTPERQTSIDLWKEYHGTNTYYSFVYKDCLFVCFDTMQKHDFYPPREPLPAEQLAWALREFDAHPDVRWTFLFMHKPIDWTSDRWMSFERKIAARDYSVFCGDWHNFCTATRRGKKYYMLGTAGGGWDGGVTSRDLRYGAMDALAWVSVTKKGPVVSYVELSGVHADPVQTCATTRGWIETPLDYPSHRAENPAKYADETNTALIPAEVEQGPGYDWHFRHGGILRRGRIFASGMFDCEETYISPSARRIILLGDETASDLKAEFPKDVVVIDLGFKGDKIQNVLWRVIEGELDDFDPDEVVVSVGVYNRAENTSAEIAAGLKKLVGYVHDRVPRAKVIVKECEK